MKMLEIREKLKTAIKSQTQHEKDILRVVIGRADTLKASTGRELSDDQVAAEIRKIIKGNNDVMGYGTPEQREKLVSENVYLDSLLPKTLSVDEIVEQLQPLVGAIREVPEEGRATGIAIKYLKAAGISALGADVANAVVKIRK